MSALQQGILKKIDDYRWEIPRSYKAGMSVPGLIFASESMLRHIMEEQAFQQVANVDFLPGIVGYSLAMAAGQLLFKAAAQMAPTGSSLAEKIIASGGSGYFLFAFALYAALSLFWVWILTFTPLSLAYPFVALAFGVTPVLAAWLFGDPLTVRILVGSGLIAFGIIVVAT